MLLQEIFVVLGLKAVAARKRDDVFRVNLVLELLRKQVRVAIAHVDTMPEREGISEKSNLDVGEPEIEILAIAGRVRPKHHIEVRRGPMHVQIWPDCRDAAA